MTPLQQESTVQVGNQSIHVRTTALVDPELLVMTEVVGEDGRVLKKMHAPMPSATVADYDSRGEAAILACLQASHLRFVQRLLSAPVTKAPSGITAPPPSRGVLATQVLGPDGKILRTVGEDQVPGSWMQVGFRLTAFAEELGRRLNQGEVRWCIGMGEDIAVVIASGETTKVCFVEPQRVAPREDLERHLEAI